MRSTAKAAAIILVAILTGAPALAEPSEPAPEAVAGRGALAIEGFVWNTSPVALRTGLVRGGGLAARKGFGDHGLFWGFGANFGGTSEATLEWNLTHLHGLATASAGIERRLGAGAVRAQFVGGALIIRQLAERQQYERLKAAGLPNLRRDRWTFGPWLGVDLGASVFFYDRWFATLHVAPSYTVQKVAAEKRGFWVLSSGLGVGRAF